MATAFGKAATRGDRNYDARMSDALPPAPAGFPEAPATFALPGPAGTLEVATAVPEPGQARAGTAVICHRVIAKLMMPTRGCPYFAVSLRGLTTMPGRTRPSPSLITRSPA